MYLVRLFPQDLSHSDMNSVQLEAVKSRSLSWCVHWRALTSLVNFERYNFPISRGSQGDTTQVSPALGGPSCLTPIESLSPGLSSTNFSIGLVHYNSGPTYIQGALGAT